MALNNVFGSVLSKAVSLVFNIEAEPWHFSISSVFTAFRDSLSDSADSTHAPFLPVLLCARVCVLKSVLFIG